MLDIITVSYERPIQLQILVNCFLVQTNPNWKMNIIHDGPASYTFSSIMDDRVNFMETDTRVNNYGHPNRALGISLLPDCNNRWLLITNDDNYYVPEFVDTILSKCDKDTGIVYYNTIHSHQGYRLQNSVLVECGIDMGAFIVRVDVAKAIGFPWTHFSADGTYAVNCRDYCLRNRLAIRYIKDKYLFVHN